jgi:hypothetical protein
VKTIGIVTILVAFGCLDATATGAVPVLLTPPSAEIPQTGGSTTIVVTTTATNAWTAQVQSGNPWLSIAGTAAGIGDGSLVLQAVFNSGPARTGILLIGGAQFTVRQDGDGSGALVTLGKYSLTLGEAAGTADVQILSDHTAGAVPSSGGASWFTVSVVPGSSGGLSVLRVTVEPNTGATSRAGQATYGDAVLNLVQAPYKTGYVNVLAGGVWDAATGQPVAGAKLFFYGSGYAYASADSNGVYSLTGADISSFGGALTGTLYAGAAGYFEASATVPDLGTQPSLPVIRDFTLRPGGTVVRGTIRDASTNMPIAGATILFSRTPMCTFMGGGTQVSVTSAADGTYTIDSSYFNESGLTSGFSLNLQVNATGYFGATRSVSTFITYPRTEDIVLTPTTGTVLKGRVIDRLTGEPIVAARLFFYGTGYGNATADSTGNYNFHGQDLNSFGGGLSGTLYAGATGYFEASTTVPDLGTQPSLPVIRDFALRPGGTIVRGTIRDASTNMGIAGATILFSRTPMCTFMGGGTQVSVTSASDGTYTIDSSYFNESGLTSGFSLNLQVDAPGYLGATRSVSTFTTYPRTEDIVLTPTSGAVLKGQVTNRTTGQPISGAQLFFYGTGSGNATADSTGNYSLRGQDIHSFGGALSGTLYAGAAGYFEASATVPDLSTQSSLPLIRNLTLRPGGTIVRGAIRDASTNAPIAGATILFNRTPMCTFMGGGTQVSVTSAADGTYIIDSSYFNESGLTSGFSLNLQVNAPGYLGASRYTGTFNTFPRIEDFSLSSYLRLDPSSANVSANPATGLFTITLQGPYAGLPWSAKSQSDWVAVTSTLPTSTGGTVFYSVDPNHSGQQRTGQIQVSVNTQSSIPLAQVLARGVATVSPRATTGTDTSFLITQAVSAAPPSVVSGSPTNTTATAQIFTFTVQDPDGFADINNVYFLINPTPYIPQNTCHGFYNRALNALYLYNDDLTFAMGPLPLGGSASATNSQCVLDGGASTVVSASGNTLVFKLRITLWGSYSHSYQNVYLWVKDNEGHDTGWVQTGTWTLTKYVPSVVSGIPTGPGTTPQTFTFSVSDQDGFADINNVYFLINTLPVVTQNSCHGLYNRAQNAFFLYNDAVSVMMGPLPAGSQGTLQNSQCILYGASSSLVSASGSNLTITVGLALQGSYLGTNQNVYLWVKDTADRNTGWVQTGGWFLAQTHYPAVVSGTPAVSSVTPQVFTFTGQDLDGYGDIDTIYFEVNTWPSAAPNSCHGFYKRAQNAFYLYNDALTVLMGPLSPGTPATLQNSRCVVYGSSSSVVSASGFNLVINVGLGLQGPYAGTRQNVYLWVKDNEGRDTGWVETGAWNLAPPPTHTPSVVAGTPTSSSFTQQTFTFTAQDLDGFWDINNVYFLVDNSAAVAPNSCHGFYNRAQNALYLYDDTLTVLMGPLTPGTSGTLQNTQCSVYGSSSSVVSASGPTLAINVGLGLQMPYPLMNQQYVYLWVKDNEGNDTGWVKTGTWGSIPPRPNTPSVTQTPLSSATTPQTFSFVAHDLDGAAYDIDTVYFLVNTTAAVTPNSCHGFYKRSQNAIYLYNDSVTVMMGPLTPGTSATLQNGQCVVYGSTSSVTSSGYDLTLNLTLGAQGSYAGTNQKIYLWARDNEGHQTGWVQTGAWNLGFTHTPSVVSGTPTNSATALQAFTFTTRDLDGFGDIGQVDFLVATSISAGQNACHGFYSRTQNALYLYSDSSTTLMGPLTPGSSGTLQNSQCVVYGNSSSFVSGSGTDLVINVGLGLQGAYLGTNQNIYLFVSDLESNVTGWVQTGTWNLI